MDPERRTRISELFDALIALDGHTRSIRLREIAAEDPRLATEVGSLLAGHDSTGVLDQLVGEMAPTVVDLAGATSSSDGLSGTTIAQYEVGELIGSGGMGDVYRARDTRLGRDVALKFLPAWLSRDRAARDRFLVEARVVSAIDHTNVCVLFDLAETDDGRLFLVMPYYSGDTLKSRLAAGPLPAAEAVSIGVQAARGLAAAHERGIIHRDIKPGNLLLTPGGHVKILDFGVAKLTDVSLTQAGQTPGTMSYMSPEQAADRPVDPRSDLWSLGAVLYEMLTGERPGGALDDSEPGRRPTALETRPGIPAGAVTIVRRLLARSPEDRYPTAHALVGDLEALQAGREVMPMPPSAHPVQRFLAELKRRRVFRVAAVYGVAGFAVIQAADVAFPRIPLPDWTVALVVWLVLLCFPLALVLAWAFESSPEGVRRTRPVGPAVLDAIVAQPAVRRWPIGLAGALGGALIVGGAWWALGERANMPASSSAGPDAASATGIVPATGVAVLPFRATGVDTAVWRAGMVDLLSFNLDGVPGLRKIDPMAVLTAWRQRPDDGGDATAETSINVARSLEAEYAVTGSVVRFDNSGSVRIRADVYDVERSRLRGSAQVDGHADSVVQLVDALTIEMLRQSLVPVGDDLPPVNLARATTSSLPALKAYLAGEEKYRRGRYDEAALDFDRAVELDSTFARALYRLANCYGWSAAPGTGALEPIYYERAARFADRLPERDAMLLRLKSAGRSGLAGFDTFTTRYPDDADGWYHLGDGRVHTRGNTFIPPQEFRDALERAVELAPHYEEPYYHLFEDAFAHLDRDRVAELLPGHDAIDPAAPPCSGYRLVYDLRWGEEAARSRALTALDTASLALLDCTGISIAAAPAWFDRIDVSDVEATDYGTLWQLFHARLWNGQPGAARRVMARGELSAPQARRNIAGFRVMLHLAGYPEEPGRLRDALEVLAASVSSTPETPGLAERYPISRFWIGALALAERRWADLDRQMAEIGLLARSESAENPSRADTIAAYGVVLEELARLERGDPPRIADLEAAAETLSPADHAPLMAAAYVRYQVGKWLIDQGRLPEAERYLLSLYPSATPYFVPAQLYLGRLYEQHGDAEAARLSYATFASWWEDADPELQPMRTEALAALKRLSPDS